MLFVFALLGLDLADAARRGPSEAAAAQATGYVCERGTPPWRDSDVLSELDSFFDAYKEQHALFSSPRRDPKNGLNYGGNGMFHSLAL
eukprot:7382397-Prymnesium_polylepis.2